MWTPESSSCYLQPVILSLGWGIGKTKLEEEKGRGEKGRQHSVSKLLAWLREEVREVGASVWFLDTDHTDLSEMEEDGD